MCSNTSVNVKVQSINLIDFSILSVNCSDVCIIYVKIYKKISSGGLEVSLSIYVMQPFSGGET